MLMVALDGKVDPHYKLNTFDMCICMLTTSMLIALKAAFFEEVPHHLLVPPLMGK